MRQSTRLLGWIDDSRSKTSLSSLMRSPTIAILVSSAILWAMCYRYLAVSAARDPTSYFFDAKKGYERIYSLQREKEALSYIQQANDSSVSVPRASERPSMCIGVATVKRPTQEQYVRATIGSLLEGLSDADRAHIHLVTFIAHTDPNQHPVYHETWLKAVSNTILTYDVSDEDMKMLRMFEQDNIPRNKSMYDYGYILENCHKTGANWITIVEDDVIATDGWYRKALVSLEKAQKEARGEKWIYLRLFYTEIFLGYLSEHMLRYLGASLAVFLTILSLGLWSRQRSSLLRRQFSNLNVTFLCLCCVPAFTALYFMAGYVTMHPPRSGVRPMPEFGCCSQGFIFPHSIVPLLVERTQQAMHEDLYVDMMMERFAERNGLIRYATFPSLLQHFGLKSSKGFGYDGNAGDIFNFRFETHPP